MLGDLERQPPHLRHRDAVRKTVQAVQRQPHSTPGGQGGLQAGGAFGFDAEHPSPRAQILHIGANAGDQAAAAHRHEHRVRTGMLVHDLHPHRALAGDDLRIVVWMHRDEALRLGQSLGLRRRLVVAVPVEYDFGTEAQDGVDLDVRRVAAHDDVRLKAQFARRQGNPLGMVAGRGGDDALGSLPGGQLVQLVVGAAQLERKNWLQILPFEHNLVAAAQALRYSPGVLQGGLRRDFVNMGGKDFLDIVLQHGVRSGNSWNGEG